MTQEEISRRVLELRKRYGESDPVRLCGSMEILLLYHPLGKGKQAIKGFFLECSRIPTITINADLPEMIRRVILAHEIGHAVLHRKEGIRAFHEIGLWDQTDRMEREANLFAAELLLEDEAVLSLMQQGKTIREAASTLYVPPELLQYKLQMMQAEGYRLPAVEYDSCSRFLKNMEVPAYDRGIE